MTDSISTPVHSRSRIPGAVDSRLSTFSPLQIAGLQFWVAADDLVLSNNDPVTTWVDKSGNSRNAVQTTSGNKPLYKTNIINSLPAVLFDASDDYMDFGSLSLSEYSYFIIINKPDASFNSVILAETDVSYTYLQYSDSWIVAGNTLSVPMINDTSYLKECVTNVSDIKRYTNGNAHTTQSTSGSHGYRYLSLSGFPAYAYLAEILIYDSALSDANRILVENFLRDKYNL